MLINILPILFFSLSTSPEQVSSGYYHLVVQHKIKKVNQKTPMPNRPFSNNLHLTMGLYLWHLVGHQIYSSRLVLVYTQSI